MQTDRGPWNIVVADDSPVDRILASRLLESIPDCKVSEFKDGQELIDSFAETLPDLVLTDLQMPNADGITVVRHVHENFPSIPVVIMTAFGSEEAAVEALQAGAASYVPKRSLGKSLVPTCVGLFNTISDSRQTDRLAGLRVSSEYQFKLPNDTALIGPLINAVKENLNWSAERLKNDFNRIRTSLHEALTNAIHHGNLELDSKMREDDYGSYFELAQQRSNEAPYRSRRVHFNTIETATELRLVVRDEGAGFDVKQFERDPLSPEDLVKPSGRGLFLIRTFMDEVSFNNAGNEITMVLRTESGLGESLSETPIAACR